MDVGIRLRGHRAIRPSIFIEQASGVRPHCIGCGVHSDSRLVRWLRTSRLGLAGGQRSVRRHHGAGRLRHHLQRNSVLAAKSLAAQVPLARSREAVDVVPHRARLRLPADHRAA